MYFFSKKIKYILILVKIVIFFREVKIVIFFREVKIVNFKTFFESSKFQFLLWWPGFELQTLHILCIVLPTELSSREQ